VALANAIGTQAAAQTREAAEIGWLKAHVRIGRSYPLLAVRVCRRAAAGGGASLVVETDQQAVLDATVYAMAIARGLDGLQVRIAALDFDASLVGTEPRLAVDLKLTPESGAAVDAETVAELAQRVLIEAAPVRTWSAGELGDVRVEILEALAPAAQGSGSAVEAVAEIAPSGRAESTTQDTGAEPAAVVTRETPEHEVQKPASADATDEAVVVVDAAVAERPRGARRSAVLLGAVIGVFAVIAAAAAVMRPQSTPARPAQPVAATSAGQAVQVGAAQAAPTAAAVAATQPAVAATPPTLAAAPPAQTAAPQPQTAAPQAEPVRANATVAPTAVPTQLAPTPAPANAQAGTTSAAPTQPRETAVLDFAPDRRDGLGWPNQRQGVAWFDPDGYHLATRDAGQFVAIAMLSGDGLANVSVTAKIGRAHV